VLEQVGLKVEVHHHEVATAGQCEIGVGFGDLIKKADDVLMLKYVVQNVAHLHGKTVTFMPKPMVGDNGNGMHVHQSLAKEGKNIFQGEAYAGLSQQALWYIGGVIKHARAINAFTNASTNTYRRLVPGFEAPTILAYSARNRSASIRIPWVSNPKAARMEIRFPDSTCNPYLGFTAMMLAGLDGIKNKIDPGKPAEMDLYELSPEEEAKLLLVSSSLDMSLDNLNKDREFLIQGDVFTNDLIDAYIDLKMKEVTRIRQATHPLEFEMYYSL
jgi:glutamine synthetase